MPVIDAVVIVDKVSRDAYCRKGRQYLSGNDADAPSKAPSMREKSILARPELMLIDLLLFVFAGRA